MGAYETWRETKKLLDASIKAHDPDDVTAYYVRVEEELRPAALKDYLETKSLSFDVDRHDWDDPADHVTPEEISEFLAGLDELRAPNTETAKQLFFNPAIGQVSRLREMNWTGDNTYGEAIDDVIQVLLAVWEGKPFPNLDRFRCPSRYKGGDLTAEVQCQVQLPHGDPHLWRDDHGFAATWTDEQSLNPPAPYDEPVKICGATTGEDEGKLICDRNKGHAGPHGDSRADAGWYGTAADSLRFQNTRNPDPINRPAQQFCGATTAFSSAAKSATLYCRRKTGHGGKHQAPSGERWEPNEDTSGRPLDTPPRCRATNAAGMQCIKPEHSQLVAHVTENGRAW